MNQGPDIDSSADDAAFVAAKVRAAGSSFYWAMRLMPPDRRAALFAIYAFCRDVDDIVDEPGTPAAKEQGLRDWREEVDRIDRDAPRTPIGRALALAKRRFGLKSDDLRAVIDGMAMDGGEPMRAPSLEQLDLYCDRVASAVGRLCIYAFGAGNAQGDKVAHELGRALQLTNILRDVTEDADIGRLYLPREYLERHGITSSDPATVITNPAVERVCLDLSADAGRHFRAAETAMAACPRETMRPARVMMEVYRRVFDKLLLRGFANLNAPVEVPKALKLWLAFRHSLF